MKIIVNGAAGRMGAEVLRMISDSARGSELAAAVDCAGGDGILSSIEEFTGCADVIIDFSHHSAVTPLLKYACTRRVPVVVCTTGHTCDEIEKIREASKYIP